MGLFVIFSYVQLKMQLREAAAHCRSFLVYIQTRNEFFPSAKVPKRVNCNLCMPLPWSISLVLFLALACRVVIQRSFLEQIEGRTF